MSDEFKPGDAEAPNPDPAGAQPDQAAADWVARRDRGLSADEYAELMAWHDADAENAAALERAEAAWRGLDRIGSEAELIALADAALIRARARRAARRLLRVTTVALAAAAAVTVTFIGWGEFGASSRPVARGLPNENYRVIESTVQRQILPDGSTAELNGASRIEVTFTPNERRVRLVDGEAHFIVAKNSERPFFVTAGPLTVRAVGTAFNVRLAAEKIEVLVTEGKVKLEHGPAASVEPASAAPPAAPLVQGQRAVIDRAAADPSAVITVGEVDKVAIEQELGWQSTRLVFNHTPLDEVVAGFNRYNVHRLTLGDPRLRERSLTGVFRADNLEGFVRLLRASVDVKAEQRTPHETVLLPIR